MPRFHEKALEAYAMCGWRLYPCIPGTKKPAIKDYYQQATNDVGQLLKWRDQWPDANFGVVTGKTSGIVALDVDFPSGFYALRALEEAFTELDHGSLIQATPNRGWHVIFRAPDRALPSRPKLLGYGLEFRAENAAILLAPSVVADSDFQTYAWTVEDVVERIKNPLPLPRWILELIEHAEKTKPVANVLRAARDASFVGLIAWLRGQKEGNRNAALFWSAKRLFEAGLPISEAMFHLSSAARETGLQDKEIESTIRSAYK